MHPDHSRRAHRLRPALPHQGRHRRARTRHRHQVLPAENQRPLCVRRDPRRPVRARHAPAADHARLQHLHPAAPPDFRPAVAPRPQLLPQGTNRRHHDPHDLGRARDHRHDRHGRAAHLPQRDDLRRRLHRHVQHRRATRHRGRGAAAVDDRRGVRDHLLRAQTLRRLAGAIFDPVEFRAGELRRHPAGQRLRHRTPPERGLRRTQRRVHAPQPRAVAHRMPELAGGRRAADHRSPSAPSCSSCSTSSSCNGR